MFPSAFMPHGTCYLWNPKLIWLNVIADAAIVLAYYAIPVLLVFFTRHHPEFRFNRIFLMFAGFILACGTTHLLEVWNVWHGDYWLAGGVKAITAIISLATAASLVPLAPHVISLPGRLALEQENRLLEQGVADRRQADELRARLAAIVESSSDAIISKTLGGQITSWNAGAEKLFGYTAAEAIGEPITMLLPLNRVGEEMDILERISGGERIEHFKTERLRKDGNPISVSVSISPIRDAKGSIIGAANISRDTGESQRQEAALRQALKDLAEQKFALDQHAIVATTDVQGTINYVNEKFCAISGYSKEELIGQNHRLLNSGYHPAEFFGDMYKAVANGRVWRGEIRNRAKNGSFYWVDTTVVPFMTDTGKPWQYVAIRADITERKRAEAGLGQLAAIVESSDDAIMSKSLEGIISTWNKGAEKLFGYTAAEAVGKPMLMLFPPGLEKQETEILGRLKRGESVEHFDTLHLNKEGRAVDVSVTISPMRDSQGLIVGVSKTARDISERKLGENALKQSEERLRLFIEHAPAALAMFDINMRYLHSSHRWGVDYGVPDRNLRGLSHYEVFPDVPDRWKEIHRRGIAGEVLVCDGDRFERADGSVQWLKWEVRPWLADDGAVGGIVIFADEITEQKLAADALSESEQRFHAMANGIPQLAFMAEPDGHLFWYNQRWYDFTGTNFEEMQGWGWQSVHDPAVLPKVLERWKAAIAMGTPFEMEFPLRGADGHFRNFLTRVVPVRDTEGKVVRWFGTNTDISERKQAEEQLAEQAEEISKLNTELEERVLRRTMQLAEANKELEAFSYSVSHDLRAPLRHINGFARLLVDDYGDGLEPTARDYLGRIQTSAKNMGELVDDLLGMARVARQEMRCSPTPLAGLVESAMRELEPDCVGREVECRIGELPMIGCDAGLMKLVFANLLSNALKYSRDRNPAIIEVGQLLRSGELVIFVRDNGVGFDQRYADKLFGVFQRLHRAEDFEGTGVGLATVQRIIHKHGGRVWAEATPDQGATFYFVIPPGAQSKSDVETPERKSLAAVSGAEHGS